MGLYKQNKTKQKQEIQCPGYWNRRVKSSMDLFPTELTISQVKNSTLKSLKTALKTYNQKRKFYPRKSTKFQ